MGHTHPVSMRAAGSEPPRKQKQQMAELRGLKNWTRDGCIGEIDESGEIAVTTIGARRFVIQAAVVGLCFAPAKATSK